MLLTMMQGITLVCVQLTRRPALHNLLVIDAGSSGTRMHAYTWRWGTGNVPTIAEVSPSAAADLVPRPSTPRAYNRVETEPALDAWLQDHRSLERQGLRPLLRWAEAVVPEKRRGLTPVFLAGTAGVRRLDPGAQIQLLRVAQDVLQRSGFLFKQGWAGAISGMQEGIYGWAALNYEQQRFRQRRAPGGRATTMGALDLGGSSLEICFESDKLSSGAALGYLSLPLFGRDYGLFCRVHHGFGLNDAFDRGIRALMIAAEGTTTHRNQSHIGRLLGEGLANTSSNFTTDLTDSRNSTGALLEHPCLPRGYDALRTLAASYDGAQVRLVGAPDQGACEALATRIATGQDRSHVGDACDAPPCALGEHQPVPDRQMPFVALSGFYVVHRFFGMATEVDGGGAELGELRRRGNALCALPWDEMQRRYGDEPKLEEYCFRAPYVTTLLTDGLRLPEDRVDVGGQRAGWPLGLALVRGADEFATSSGTILSGLFPDVVLGGLCIAALAAAGVLVWLRRRRQLPATAINSFSAGQRSISLASLVQLETGSLPVEDLKFEERSEPVVETSPQRLRQAVVMRRQGSMSAL